LGFSRCRLLFDQIGETLAERKKIPRTLSYALTGWIAGAAVAIALALAWPIIFPGILHPEHYYGFGPNVFQLLLLALVIMTPAAMVGGIVGGRLSIEGGDRGQRVIAIIMAIVFSFPFTCFVFWIFTGF
jgi:hypothetical protein